jgi:hypothetical protein
VRIFVTGSTDGLGRAAAHTLLQAGHAVVVHARSNGRLAVVRDLTDRGAAAVVGDLADADEVRGVAEQVNRHGPIDAVIHNAGVYSAPPVLPVNVVAPYLLTALLHPAGTAGLPQQKHALQRTCPSRWTGLERSARDRLILGQQAARHDPDGRGRRHAEQRRGSRVGAHADGPPRRAG